MDAATARLLDAEFGYGSIRRAEPPAGIDHPTRRALLAQRMEPHLSVIAGGLSAGFQPLVKEMALLHNWILPVVFLASMGPLLFATLPFIAKERLRYLSPVGMGSR